MVAMRAKKRATHAETHSSSSGIKKKAAKLDAKLNTTAIKNQDVDAVQKEFGFKTDRATGSRSTDVSTNGHVRIANLIGQGNMNFAMIGTR